MRWKLKAAIQNAVSHLPSEASYDAYYWMQRHFGGLRRCNPVDKLAAGVEVWRRIQAQGIDPCGKVFFEVGTGRVPLMPVAYWLMGAQGIVTVDLNPYMKGELIAEHLSFIATNRAQIASIFGGLLLQDRLDMLVAWAGRDDNAMPEFLDLCKIRYIAPGDAASTGLPEGSVDFHTSYNVFEHIPRGILHAILAEGCRITTADGLFVHRIDYSDHFSHSDPSISAVNFLQYSDRAWDKLAGNRYMYMNRLRHGDFIELFRETGLDTMAAQADTDQRSLQLLRSGRLRLDRRFESMTTDMLAITASWMLARHAQPKASSATAAST